MLYYFDYDFDHKEKKLKELPVGWFYQNNLVSWCSGIVFLGLSLILQSRTAEITTAWVSGATGIYVK